jgi:hypothetical protein
MKKKLLFAVFLGIAIAGCKKKDDVTPEEDLTEVTPTDNSRIEWEKLYGKNTWSDVGCGVYQTATGNYIVAGDSLTIVDAAGKLISKVNVSGKSITPTKDGNYLLSAGSGTNIYKVTATGTILWTKSTGSGSPVFIQETQDGNIIGTLNGGIAFKMDATGNMLWTKSLSTTGLNDYFDANEIQQVKDGGYVVVGSQVTGSNGGLSQFVVCKLNVSGNIQWTRTYGAWDYTDDGYSIKATPDGGCIAAGISNLGFFDFQLIKLDAAGNTTWDKHYGKDDVSEEARYVQLTADGGYILVGSSDVDGNATTSNIAVLKTDANGTQQWMESYGGAGIDFGRTIQSTKDGGYIITGIGNYTSSSPMTAETYLIKLKP